MKIKQNSERSLIQFNAYCIPTILFGVGLLLLVAFSMVGIKLPLDAQTFENAEIVKVLSIIAGVFGIISGVLGKMAVKSHSLKLLRTSAWLSALIAVLFCAMLICADGHSNPQAWVAVGMAAIIPGGLAGTALRFNPETWERNT